MRPFAAARSRELFVCFSLVLFVLLWPLERRHLVFTEYSFITGAFTEGGTLALYASDVAFVLLCVAWLFWRFRGEHLPKAAPRSLLLLSLGLVVWAVLRAAPGGTSQPHVLGLYGAARIAQGVLLLVMIRELWNVSLFRRSILLTLLGAGLLQSAFGIAQVIRMSDLGLRALGEPPLTLEAPGVAKVDIMRQFGDGDNVSIGTFEREPVSKILRAYGTFPHPNVLGGFLIASTAASIALFRGQLLSNMRILGVVTLSILLVGVVLSFSRTSWFSLSLLAIGTMCCSPRNIDKVTFSVILMSIIVSIGTITFIPLGRESLFHRVVPLGTDRFLEQRIFSYEDALFLLRNNLFLGSGTGLYLPSLFRNVRNIDKNNSLILNSDEREPWEYFPPHSVPLLIAVELGLLGLGFFLSLLWVVFKPFLSAPTGGQLHRPGVGVVGRLLIVLSVALPLLTDHYLWTTQQGRILFWGGLGMLAALGSEAVRQPLAPAVPIGTGAPTVDRRSTVQ